jgi:hypothetical protein
VQVFEQMDAAATESGKQLRLLGEEGIPGWVRGDGKEEAAEGDGDDDADVEEGSRRRRRARKDVVYDENLSEVQFCRLVDAGASHVRIFHSISLSIYIEGVLYAFVLVNE